MKKLLIIPLLLLNCTVQGEPYDFGQTVPIPFVVFDTTDGEPITPDSIKIAVYYESGTTPVVAPTTMTNWNSKTGEYYYNFTTPDSGGVYTPRVHWGAQGKAYVLWLDNICVGKTFDVGTDTIFADVVKLSGDPAAAGNAEYFFDGTGAAQGVVLSARRLSLENNTSSPAFYVYNSGGTAAKFYTDHTASGENWSYGLALLSGSGQSAPLRVLGAGNYTGIYGNLLGSVKSVTDTVNARANVLSISDDNAAADNLEYFLDGTGHMHGVKLSASQLKLNGDYVYEGALHVENSGGNAAYFKTTSPVEGAAGLYLLGNNAGNTAYGLNMVGDNPNGDAIGDWDGTITADAANAAGQILAVAPPHWSADDSAAYQGEASGMSVADIWNYSERTIAGGWVDSNKTETGSSMGEGMYSRAIIVIDSAAQCPIPGVRLAVRSIDQSVLVAGGITGPTGTASFNLGADSYLIVAQAPAYIFAAFDTIAVDGPGYDSLFGYRFDPGHPAAPDLCRVYGYVYNVAAEPEEGAEIHARLSAGARRYGGAVVSPLVNKTQSDSLGYFSLDLIPSALLDPDSPAYEISITLLDGTILRQNILVPDQNFWQLTW